MFLWLIIIFRPTRPNILYAFCGLQSPIPLAGGMTHQGRRFCLRGRHSLALVFAFASCHACPQQLGLLRRLHCFGECPSFLQVSFISTRTFWFLRFLCLMVHWFSVFSFYLYRQFVSVLHHATEVMIYVTITQWMESCNHITMGLCFCHVSFRKLISIVLRFLVYSFGSFFNVPALIDDRR